MNPTTVVVKGVGSFLHLFKPKAVQAGGEPKYSMQLVFATADSEVLNAITPAIQAAAAEKFGANFASMALHYPITDPMTKEKLAKQEFYQGKLYMNCTTGEDTKPDLVNVYGEPIIDAADLYSGCLVAVELNFYGYDRMGNKGVSAGLNKVMKLADGERLDSRLSVEESFGGFIQKRPDGGVAAGSVPGMVPGQQQPAQQAQQPVPQTDPATGMPVGNAPGGIIPGQ